MGSSEQLRAWATDEAYNSQVVASHFMRVYRNETRQQEEYEKLSDDLKKIVDQTNKSAYSAQIQQKNQEMVKSTWNKESVKIEAQEEETGISQQSNTKLQKLRSELRLKHR